LKDFEGRVVQNLEELHELYVHIVQTIGGLCLPMPMGEPSVDDYLCWLSAGIFDLPGMFGGVNENFATAAIEGALAMARDSVGLSALQVVAAESGVGILPTECSVRRAVQVVSKNCWRSFGYDSVLAAIHTNHKRYLFIRNLLF
jgi:hypothetical protein